MLNTYLQGRNVNITSFYDPVSLIWFNGKFLASVRYWWKYCLVVALLLQVLYSCWVSFLELFSFCCVDDARVVQLLGVVVNRSVAVTSMMLELYSCLVLLLELFSCCCVDGVGSVHLLGFVARVVQFLLRRWC